MLHLKIQTGIEPQKHPADLYWVELNWDSLNCFLKTPIYQNQCWGKCFHDNCNIAVWCTALRFDEIILFLWPQVLWLELYRLGKIHHDIFKQEKVQNKSIFIQKRQGSVMLLTTYTLQKCLRFWLVNSVTAASTSISTLGEHLLRLSGLPHTLSAFLTKCIGYKGVPIRNAGKNRAITAFLSLLVIQIAWPRAWSSCIYTRLNLPLKLMSSWGTADNQANHSFHEVKCTHWEASPLIKSVVRPPSSLFPAAPLPHSAFPWGKSNNDGLNADLLSLPSSLSS